MEELGIVRPRSSIGSICTNDGDRAEVMRGAGGQTPAPSLGRAEGGFWSITLLGAPPHGITGPVVSISARPRETGRPTMIGEVQFLTPEADEGELVPVHDDWALSFGAALVA